MGHSRPREIQDNNQYLLQGYTWSNSSI
ncbi:unnamed protein product [Callosobruchus maculatus]|uniref:Uncharacterized protein n=1 Tax=Callosobruchus maculatus TaxID=64391 RepID=A0A653CZE3_CALMS|nr:unnamed protein product [Callosobruchus maculatus]